MTALSLPFALGTPNLIPERLGTGPARAMLLPSGQILEEPY